MVATKAELEKQVKTLKEEVRKLRGEAKSVTSELEGLENGAHGLILREGEFRLVSIKFDEKEGKAAIEKIKPLGNSLALASTRIKEAVIDDLIEINKGR